MAIYHFHATLIGRSKNGKATAGSAYVSGSAVAGGAYRAGEKIKCEWDERTHDYTHKTGIIHAEIMLPENAPVEFMDRATLWNAVELKNKRKDSQLAREVDMALPKEFTHDEQIEAVRDYIERNFTSQGICADFAIHDKGDGNPHAHIMFTMDKVSEKGIGLRLEAEQDKVFYLQKQRLLGWREDWANVCNKHLEAKGLAEKIDHRSFANRGIDRVPTIHLGKEAAKLEKQGKKTERGDRNRQIIDINVAREKQSEIARLQESIPKLKNEHDNIVYKISELQESNRGYWREQRRTLHNARRKSQDITRLRTRITEIEQDKRDYLHEQSTLSIFRSGQKKALQIEIDMLDEERERIERHLERTYRIDIEHISELSDSLYSEYAKAYRAIEDRKITVNGTEIYQNIHSVEIRALRKKGLEIRDEYKEQRNRIATLTRTHKQEQPPLLWERVKENEKQLTYYQ